VCFPHADGAASFFRSWVSWLPEKIELIAACYTGREDRIAESPAAAMAELVAPSVRAWLSLSDAPLALFGYSMGRGRGL
jgi:pyochelin biosynthetic protein PchC